MLGSAFHRLLAPEHEVISTGTTDIDITNPGKVLDWVDDIRPEYIINCAAYTDVDGAEIDTERSWDVNVNGAMNIAIASRNNHSSVVHFSTDYIFDGEKMSYKETDMMTANPLNHYGFTKLHGERKFCSHAQWCFIVRTSWLFHEDKKNFVRTMLKLFRTKDSVKVVNDQLGRPTYAPYLAKVTCRLLFGKEPTSGSWNVANSGITSWYQFAVEIYRVAREIGLLDREVEIIPVPTKEVPRLATRPRFSVLDTKRVEGQLGAPLRSWKKSLRDCLQEIKRLELQ